MSYSVYKLLGETNLNQICRRQDLNNQNFLLGRINTPGALTLTANSATTVVTFPEGNLSNTSVLIWMPKTANAAAAMTNLYRQSTNVAQNTITLAHANNAQTDRNFDYILIG
jgi:2',3'-cyclic-nucleotide 2'-phosphodiesterase (5'-nucleotidase family)